MTYKATIHYDSYEDNYENGEAATLSSSWTEKFSDETLGGLKNRICQLTNSEWEHIEHDDANEYPTKSEYWTSYLADQYNISASRFELEQWQKGQIKLWVVHCHILACQLTETKVVL